MLDPDLQSQPIELTETVPTTLRIVHISYNNWLSIVLFDWMRDAFRKRLAHNRSKGIGRNLSESRSNTASELKGYYRWFCWPNGKHATTPEGPFQDYESCRWTFDKLKPQKVT